MKTRYRRPVQVTKTSWFYENPRSIELIVECRTNGFYHRTQSIRIPKRLLESLELGKRVREG